MVNGRIDVTRLGVVHGSHLALRCLCSASPCIKHSPPNCKYNTQDEKAVRSVELYLVLDIKMSKAPSVRELAGEVCMGANREVLRNSKTLKVRPLCLDLTQINDSHGMM